MVNVEEEDMKLRAERLQCKLRDCDLLSVPSGSKIYNYKFISDTSHIVGGGRAQ